MRHIYFILIILAQFISFVPAQAQNKKDKDYKANMAFNAGEYAKAVDMYKTAFNKIKDKNRQNEVIFKIAECYRIIRDTRKAELWYKKAVSKNYQDPVIYLRYGEMLMMSESYPEAAEQFKRYKELVPDDPRGENGIRSCQVAVEWLQKPTGYEVVEMRYFNSKERDYSPTFGEEDFSTIYFTSTREGATGKETSGASGESFSDIFVSNKDRKGKWSTPVPAGEVLNSEADDGTPNVSADFTTLYFTRCPRGKKEQLGCFIFYSRRSGGEWGKPEKIKISEDSVVVAHPAISPDNLILYFVSNLPGGFGGKDLWKVSRDNEGSEWSKPVNMGEDINTPGDEMFPYVHPDGALYFSSDSHIGLGGLDIYKATPGENDRWSVENMRPPVNSSLDDFGITFEKEEERGFFSSSRKGKGNDEIYEFYLPPLKFNLTGVVRDEKTDKVLKETSVKSIGSDGVTVEALTNEEGAFRFMLKPNTDYVFIASKNGYLNGKERETTKGLEKSNDFRTVIYLSSVDQVIELPNIYYDFGKWDLRPESMVALDKLVETLNDNPNVTIELMSHTDSRGTIQDNEILSQKRAQSVVDYLITNKIAPDRLQAKGYGESVPKVVDEKIAGENKFLSAGQVLTEEFINALPVTNNEQEIAHQVNRRTEFRVLSTDYVPRK
jgi:peptidoglycan-associated lipoprotein